MEVKHSARSASNNRKVDLKQSMNKNWKPFLLVWMQDNHKPLFLLSYVGNNLYIHRTRQFQNFRINRKDKKAYKWSENIVSHWHIFDKTCKLPDIQEMKLWEWEN